MGERSGRIASDRRSPSVTGEKPPRRPAEAAAEAVGAAVAVMGGLVLVGWATGIGVLIGPAPATTKQNGACGMVLCGVGLWAVASGRAGVARRASGWVCSVAAALLGLASLTEIVFAIDLGLDKALFTFLLSDADVARVRPSAAVLYTLTGLGLLVRAARAGRHGLLAEALFAVSGLVAFASIIGFMVGLPLLWVRGQATAPVGVYAAVAMLAVNVAALASSASPRGLAAVVFAPHAGGRVARLLLPWAVILPPVLAGLLWRLEHRGWIDGALGLGTLTVTVTASFAVAIITLGRSLNQTEVNLQQATAATRHLAAVVQSSSDAIIASTVDGRVTTWNPGAEQLFGYTVAEAVGADYITLTSPPQEWERMRSLRAEVAAGGQIEHLEGYRVRKDGTTIEVSASAAPILDDTGTVTGISAISHDITARRQAESCFRQLAAIVESSQDAINVVGLDGRITAWNPGAERMFGYPAAQAIGQAAAFMATGPEAVEVTDRFARASRGEPVAPYETKRARADGRIIDVSVSLAPVRDGDGRVTAVSVIARDITAAKTAQTDQARLAAIVEGSNDAIVAKSLTGIITAWNPGAEALYGYTTAEAVGRPMTIVMTDADARELPTVLDRIAAGQRIPPHDAQRITKDGRVIDVSVTISPVVDETGTVVGAAAIARDITAVKAAQAEQARLAAIVRASDDAITATDLHGRITAWNPGAERMFGYRAREMLGQIGTDLLGTPHDAITVADRLDRIAAGQTVERYEAQRRRKDGTVIDLSVALSAMIGPDGSVTGVSCVARDVTEAKAAQARDLAIQARSQTAERLENLGQLAGGVAHDFNNLLGVIINYAEFIAGELPHDSHIRGDLDQISKAAQRGAALTDQLMVFSRKQPAKTDTFDLNSLLHEVRDLLERTIGEHIQLIVTPTATPLPVRADHSRMQQVLLNMAFNARDAMPSGGTLVIEATGTEMDDDDSAVLLGLESGRYARLLVSDTGTGMPPDVAAHIFEPFYTTKPKGQGTGLGLATAYATVTELGGTIKVYSEPDLGTTMRIYLPQAEILTQAPQPAEAAEPPRGHGQLVLVVEDEPAIREMVRRVLESHGYSVTAVGNGRQALDLIGPDRIDLLLTDVIMPELNGRELAETLHQRIPELPVIFMSGYSEGLLTTQSLLNDGTRLVQKPFSARELLQTVHAVLAGASTSPRSQLPFTSTRRPDLDL